MKKSGLLSASGGRAERSEKCERARFDALPRRRACGRVCVVERRVRRESRAPVYRGVVHLEHDRLVAAHPGKIEPLMLRIVFDPIRLPYAIRVASLGNE